jgi:hypothetical protein
MLSDSGCTNARLALPLLIAWSILGTGCAGRSGGLAQWQQDLQDQVQRQGGDTQVLRETTLRDGRPGYVVFSNADPQKSTDTSGLLIGHRISTGRPWFVYVVGTLKKQEPKELRLVALSVNQGRFDWRVGTSDAKALQTYLAADPARGFPREGDRFDLTPGQSGQIIAVHRTSGARWELPLTGSAAAQAQ